MLVQPCTLRTRTLEAPVELRHITPSVATVWLVTDRDAADLQLGHDVALTFWFPKTADATDQRFESVAKTVWVEPRAEGGVRGLLISVFFLELRTYVYDPSGLLIGADPSRELSCPKAPRPLAWCDHPWYFNSTISLTVHGFRERGLRVGFGLKSKGLMVGHEIDLTLALPALGTFETRGRVTAVRMAPTDEVGMALVQFIEPSPRLLVAIARFLLAEHPEATPALLERFGYPLPALESAVIVRFVADETTMRDVLRLRLDAYRNRPGAALDDITEPEQMRDAFDDHAVQLALKVG
ncbi:MAG: hypothetical protein KC620_16215, partial [Myxococcales bacterium]|nr:hypothetical protein [Myxococcales bacterium]